MQKIKIITALSTPIIALFLWVVVLCAKYMLMPEIIVTISGYDPRDLISGHYIAYTIDWDNTDCTQFSDGKCPKEEFEHYGLNEYWGKQYRFYIPEKHAEKLDKMFRLGAGNHKFEVVYKYASGIKPLAKELRIDGKPWQENINNTSKEEEIKNESN